eukprot:363636_1
MKRYYYRGGSVPRRKIFDDQTKCDYIMDLCTMFPTKTYVSYSDDLYASFGVYVSDKTVMRFFKSKRWTWKRISKVALELDVTEEMDFWGFIQQLIMNKNQLLFLDESHRSDRT